MSARNYGLTQRAGGTDPGAQPQSRLRHAPNVTQRNPEIPPHLARYYDERNSISLAAATPPELRPDLALDEESPFLERDRAAAIFVAGCFASPVILLGLFVGIIKLFE